MSYRWVFTLLLASACHSTAPATTTTTPPPPLPEQSGILGPDGAHVATERVYEGECMPAGSRGGCHTVTLKPDGTFVNFLFDAAMNGTYAIAGTTVTLTVSSAEPITMTLAADGTKLDALALKP